MSSSSLLHDCKLDNRLYFKPTDTHQPLHKSSCHPKHTFKGVVKSQPIRCIRLCSRNEYLKKATRTSFSVLLRRGYFASKLNLRKQEPFSFDLALTGEQRKEKKSLYLIMRKNHSCSTFPVWRTKCGRISATEFKHSQETALKTGHLV